MNLEKAIGPANPSVLPCLEPGSTWRLVLVFASCLRGLSPPFGGAAPGYGRLLPLYRPSIGKQPWIALECWASFLGRRMLGYSYLGEQTTPRAGLSPAGNAALWAAQ
jgi:hypothetical protein